MIQYKDVPLSLKELSNDGEFAGYASVFDVRDDYGDIVIKGAFAKSLKSGPVPKLLYQHDTTRIIGEHTLLREDDKGLYIEGILYKDDEANNDAKLAYSLAKRGQLDGLSIGYSLNEPPEYDKGLDAYLLKSIQLWENSLVTFPANPDARVQTVKRSLAHSEIPSPRDLERALRELGFSKSRAKQFMAGGYKMISADDEIQAVNELARLFRK